MGRDSRRVPSPACSSARSGRTQLEAGTGRGWASRSSASWHERTAAMPLPRTLRRRALASAWCCPWSRLHSPSDDPLPRPARRDQGARRRPRGSACGPRVRARRRSPRGDRGGGLADRGPGHRIPPGTGRAAHDRGGRHRSLWKRRLGGLRVHAPAGTQVVIVANDPSQAQAAGLASGSPDLDPLGGAVPEVLWTSARLGHAAALNAGLRRAGGAIIVLADASVEPTGDALTPLLGALAQPDVAVAGAFGVVAPDLRHFEEAAGPEVDAIDGGWLAFRRADLLALGPLDERFVLGRYLDIWWSLVLRAGMDPARPSRRAL